MSILLLPSPSVNRRYRVVLPEKIQLDFGDVNRRYYIDHKSPTLMRKSLIRRGAIIPQDVLKEKDYFEIHRKMLKVEKSHKEDWESIYSEEFWDRWLLMSYDDMRKSKLFLTMTKGVTFKGIQPI